MSRFVFNVKKYKNGIDYDRDRDYSAEMEKAKKEGNTQILAQLEDERNKKIEGEKLPYRKTYDYIDIGTKIENGIRDKANPSEIKELVDARRDKAVGNEKLQPFKNDEIQKRGLKYYYDEESGAGYEMRNRPEKVDSYSDDIKKLINRIKSREDFEYDIEDDDVFKNIKAQLENGAKRAMTDVLAEIGQNTGGKSSYGVSAAMQAASKFTDKLAEEMPKLYELAYKRYQDSLGADIDALDATIKAKDEEDESYNERLTQWNKDREYGKKAYEDALSVMAEEDEKIKEAEDKAIESARELIKYYEKNGIPASEALLALADMEDFSELNKENADYYENKLLLDALVKSKQVENYNARTSKTYNDMAINQEKLKLQKGIDGYDLENYEGIVDRVGGVVLSGKYYTKDKFDIEKKKENVVEMTDANGNPYYTLK